MRCYFGILLVLAAYHTTNGQMHNYTKELSFKTDNDAYIFQKKDGYYTNGMFIKLNTASEKNQHKIITSYELGQMIFTPKNVFFYRETGIDRPFCGYLYFTYNKAYFLAKQQIVQWAANIGTVGPNSLGEQVQESFHKLFKYKNFKSWDTQIANEVGLNFTLKYATVLTPIKSTKHCNIIPECEITLGNTFTNAKAGGYLCFGVMEDANNSSLFNAGIGKTNTLKRKTECFAYWHPQFIYQLYNATVQGGLFTNDTQNITAPIWSTMYVQCFGLQISSGRVAGKLEIVYQTQEAKTQQQPQRYVGASIGYRFH